MTVVIKSYRFDLPPPAFTETNYSKGHWPIIHTTEADLKDYPDLHEMLGIECIISDRIYDGDNINFTAIYTNDDTDEHIFTSTQSVPDPGDSGYNYWNSYRIASWIGSCHWEVSEPMVIRINVLVRKGVLPIGVKQFIFTVTETIIEPPTPGPCPDFWEDPVGWTVCTITNGFSEFASWFGGAFWTVIGGMTDWMNTFGSNVAAFIRDPIPKIEQWGTGVFAKIGEITDQISTGIGDWWTTTTADIGEWWNDRTQDVAEWYESVSGEIGDWWTGSWEDISGAISEATEGFLSWGEDLLTDIWEGIQDWVVDLIVGLIGSFNSGFDQGIEDQKTLRKKEED